MSREWKPGDVALVEVGCWANRIVAIRTGVPSNMGWAYCGTHHEKTTNNWSADDSGIVTPIRPLVVIDPEDREQVADLMGRFSRIDGRIFGFAGVDDMQQALREFANPKPPKPDEPMGLGAVVEDAKGSRWVRIVSGPGRLGAFHWIADGRGVENWPQIDVVRVLSHGHDNEADQ